MDESNRFFVHVEGDCNYMSDIARKRLSDYSEALKETGNPTLSKVKRLAYKLYEHGGLVELRGYEILLKFLLENPIPRDPSRRKNSPTTDRAITKRVKLIKEAKIELLRLLDEVNEEDDQIRGLIRTFQPGVTNY